MHLNKRRHCFCLDAACQHSGDKVIYSIKVVGSKIALLVNDCGREKTSLVVIRPGEHIWEEKTLACFPSPIAGCRPTASFLATARDWVSVVNRFATGPRLDTGI